VIANSATVLANLAYLIGAVVVAVVVGLLVWLKHRKPKSVDANMASFRRGLSALAPDADGSGPATRPAARVSEGPRIRPVPVGLTHVRLEPGDGPSGSDGGREGGEPG
jgi:hypothetical protein